MEMAGKICPPVPPPLMIKPHPRPLPRREGGRVTFGCIVVHIFTHILVLFILYYWHPFHCSIILFSPPYGGGVGERLLFKLRITVQYLCCRLSGCLCFAVGRLFRVLGISGIYQHRHLRIMHPLFLQLGCIAADTQYHADVGTVDESGCTTLADEWKRLSRDGCQTYGNHHVEQRLRDEQQGYSGNEESGESAVAFLAIRPTRTNRQT